MQLRVENPLTRLTLAELRTRTSMKWRTYPDDVLPLWVAEMDVPTPEPVAEALAAAVRRGDTGYPIGDAYALALGEFAQKRWGWDGVTPERSAIVPDVMLGVVEMLKLVTGPGAPVVVNSPVYPPFYDFVGHMDREVVEAPLGADGRIDFDALEGAFQGLAEQGRRGAYLLCNPQNPTGVVHTPQELERVAGLSAEYGMRVVADEIHAPLVASWARFTPYLSVPGAEDGLSLMSASKGWNLAGLKAALALAGPASAAELARMPEEVGHGPSHLGVIAHVAALRDGGPWLDALLAGLDANRALLADLLAAHLPGVTWQPGPGTYLQWLDCRALNLLDDPAEVFLERGHVAVNSGIPFGTGGEGRVRINIATSPQILTEALERMGAAVGRN
ncbi:aminotransferase class I/II-fold pyridoxal phosphate-dependent enzyme [Catenulispora yoronensis]|uniref:cysteine-S-conjugate beta-lyase n=1 Tax=Catenulispora yoronensis TaxID=450799 RepID=A0ABP5FJE5_9ACTN